MNDGLARRIADALERIADADERRNELLLEDRAERRASWEAEQALQAERWSALGHLEGLGVEPQREDEP